MIKQKSLDIKVAIVCLVFAILYPSGCFSQSKNSELNEIREQFVIPEWFDNAGFGIWLHWGAQSKPEEGGGWYARHMYMQDVKREKWGKKAYGYHLKTYGHPSKIGFKDVINQWKAEKLDPDALVTYFKDIGAKYFMVLANHHDHFDNFNSTHHQWNSVNVGPKKDIVGVFRESAAKNDIPFGVSSHDDRFLEWWKPAFGADTTGTYKGVPYDGHLTAEDGKGKWWEGLDPARLYGLPPEKRTPEWERSVKETWVKRHKELAIKYDVDMLWFDGYGFPYDDYGREVIKAYYEHKNKTDGKFSGVVVGKIANEPLVIQDIERGGAEEILEKRWQSIITFGGWFYKSDTEIRHNARTIIEMLADANSKNGNLMLNVELYPDGSIPQEQKNILDELGTWMEINSEAIYATTNWQIYGDNLNSVYETKDGDQAGEVDLAALKKAKENQSHFNERTVKSQPYGSQEVRFSVKNNILYVFVLNPETGNLSIPSLGRSSNYEVKEVQKITMLGSTQKISFDQQAGQLQINVPKERPTDKVVVYKVEGAL